MTTFYVRLKIDTDYNLTLRDQAHLKRYIKSAVLTMHGGGHPEDLETIVFGDAKTKVQASLLAMCNKKVEEIM